eukprot:135677_1
MSLSWICILLFGAYSFHSQAQVTHTETFECVGIDACKKRAIQCKPETDCVVVCNGKTACLDIMVIGLNARDVTMICTPEDTCKGGTLLCGSGNCKLDCMAATGKNICNAVTVQPNNAISFECPNECPDYIAPLIFTATPTTAIPTMNPVLSDRHTLRSTTTKTPTSHPTFYPTQSSAHPTTMPTHTPTIPPTFNPTHAPSTPPTRNPTMDPSDTPTYIPTINPSMEPSKTPTDMPSSYPTTHPTYSPIAPTHFPTIHPTDTPSEMSTSDVIISTANTVDIDDDTHKPTPTPIVRYIPHPQHNITKTRTIKPTPADENASIIGHLGNLHILWYISGAAMIILCCSLCILIAFCLSVQHGIKSVESDLSLSHSASVAQALNVQHKKLISDTSCYSAYSPFDMDLRLAYENEDKNSNAESSSSEAHNVEFEDYEDYDEYDELREGSEWTEDVRPTSNSYHACSTGEEDSKAEEKQTQPKTYTFAITRAQPQHVSSGNHSFASLLAGHGTGNPFSIEPVADDHELEYDVHYLTIAKLRGQSLSINPEVDESTCFGSDDDDVTDFIEHLESETMIKRNDDDMLMPPVFNVPVSQVTLDREPSHDQSPTLNSVISQYTDDSLYDLDS